MEGDADKQENLTLDQQAAEIEALAGGDTSGAEKSGDFDPRAHMAEMQAEAEKMPSSEMFKAVFQGGSAVAAGRYGDHWLMTEQEAAIMGVAVGDVFDKYMPDFKTSPESTLVMVSFSVFAPKYFAHVAAKKSANDESQEPKKEADRQPEKQGSRVPVSKDGDAMVSAEFMQGLG